MSVRPWLLASALALAVSNASSAAPDDSEGSVATLAGSGAPGSLDGNATGATFFVPAGIVRAPDGTIEVSDEAGQRIRAIRDGVVSTLAGGGPILPLGLAAEPGDRDGPAAQALFDEPLGLALGPDGTLYIADSKNAKVRTLRDGVVATVLSKADGLRDPHALALDSSGNLWIADFSALRVWNGRTLETIALDPPATAIVSVAVQPDDGTVLVAARQRVYRYDPVRRTAVSDGAGFAPAEGEPFGFPDQIVGLGRGRALFTDAFDDDVRYVRFPAPPDVTTPLVRVIAGGDRAPAELNAGFADGPASHARFHEPRGIAVDGATAFIADGGNRRVRSFALPQAVLTTGAADAKVRGGIVLIGNAEVAYDDFGDDSLCAAYERAAKTDAAPACRAVRVDGAAPAVLEARAASLAAEDAAWIVILLDSATAPALDAASVRTLLGQLASHRTRLAFLWQDDAALTSDGEREWIRQLRPGGDRFPGEAAPGARAAEMAAFATLGALGAVQCDTYDTAIAEERESTLPLELDGPVRAPTARGKIFLATELAACLTAAGRPSPPP